MRHCEGAKQREQSLEILNFSGVLGTAAPKGLGHSPYKICEQRGLLH